MIICKFFKEHKVHSPYGLVHFFWSLKNLLVLINFIPLEIALEIR